MNRQNKFPENHNLGKSRKARKEEIKLLLKKEPEDYYYVQTGNNQEIKIPVYKIGISLAIYRLENRRTKSQQRSFCSLNNLEFNFFSEDPEKREAIQIQHELLFKIASTDNKNHYEMFKNGSYDSSMPMIINSDGILINGNTRMSALRQLYYENESQFTHYSTIMTAILPDDVTKIQENYIEKKLQLDPDMKIPYSWLSEALDIEERYTNEGRMDSIINDYNRKKTEIEHPQNRLDCLKMANRFLELTGQKNNLDILQEEAYAMWSWSKYYNKWYKRRGPYDQERISLLDDFVVDIYSKTKKGRTMEVISDQAKIFESNVDEFLVEEEKDENLIENPPKDPSSVDSPFDELLGIDEESSGEKKKKKVVKKRTSDESRIIKDEIKNEIKRKKDRTIIFKDLSETIKKIESHIFSIKDKSRAFDKIDETLSLIPTLKEKLNDLEETLKNKE